MSFAPFPLETVAGSFLLGFPALFSIVNPIGSSLVFYNLTAGRTHAERAMLARRVAVYALLILLGSLVLGGYILNFFGVSLGALRVGGGLVVAVQAWNLLLAPDPKESESVEKGAPVAQIGTDIAFFPLTMPLTTGPGSISVAIALASERPEDASVLSFFAGLTLAALANAVAVWISYVSADRVLKLMGPSGVRIVGRLAAFLLLCIGVQIVGSGVESFFGPWLLHPLGKPG